MTVNATTLRPGLQLRPNRVPLRHLPHHCAGSLLFASGVGARVRTHESVILAFHRVNPDLTADGLTCPPGLFDAICSLVRQHFEVLSLGELVERLDQPAGPRQRLAITFDDGYLDNLAVAAPILRDHQLPATFFITHDFIGTRSVPFWDRHLEQAPAWMNWRQVAELCAMGFNIGSHTLSHPDLGRLEGAAAEREIIDSRRRLQDRTGQEIDHFAYPFGRPEQISPANRELVRKAGYRSCSSCYGGSNDGNSSVFQLQRAPVADWYASASHFGLTLKAGRA